MNFGELKFEGSMKDSMNFKMTDLKERGQNERSSNKVKATDAPRGHKITMWTP